MLNICNILDMMCRFLKKSVLEELLAKDEIEKVHVRRGGGGEDEQGRKLDSLKTAGGPKEALPPDFRLPQKEAWFWRLKSTMPSIDDKPKVKFAES